MDAQADQFNCCLLLLKVGVLMKWLYSPNSRIFPHNPNFLNDFYDIKKIKDYILRIVYLVYKYLYVNMSLYHLVNFPCL